MINSFNNFTFTNPEYFLFLVLLPIIWKFVKDGQDKPRLRKFPAIILIAKNKSSDKTPSKYNYINVLLKLFLIFLLTILLTNPSEKKRRTKGIINYSR